MTIASALTALNQDIQDARSAITAKGGTVTSDGGSSQLATDIATIPSGGSGKYQLLERIKDDSNNEIGTVSGFFTDANDIEYAVVCLDAQYRNSSTQWMSSDGTVTNLPIFNYNTWGPWRTKETATSNCDKILAYANSIGYTSSAVTHCRNQSFTIDGVTYHGQIPNVIELFDIVRHWIEIQQVDGSSTYTTLAIKNKLIWSSNQQSSTYCWYLTDDGRFAFYSKTNTYMACPILEIPNSEQNTVNWHFTVHTMTSNSGIIDINGQVHNIDDGDFDFTAIIGVEYTITISQIPSEYYSSFYEGYITLISPYTERASIDRNFEINILEG